MSTAKTRNKKGKAPHTTASTLIARFNEKSQKQTENWNRSNPNSRKTSYNKSDIEDDDTEHTNNTQAHKLAKTKTKTKYRNMNIPPPPECNKSIPPPPPSPPPSPPPFSARTANKSGKSKNKPFTKTKPSLTRPAPSQLQPQPAPIFTFNVNHSPYDTKEEYDKFDELDASDSNYKTMSLPQSLNNEQTSLSELHGLILLYQQAVHDVNQAIVDVKQTSQDITSKVKSVTEQLHIIIDRREDELLDEITKKTASKIFALDSQFTKLTQRLMFCREARDEAESLLAKHYEYNSSANAATAPNINYTKTRDHSSGSVGNYNMRKERIMNIVNKTKQDARNEFESELNRGTPVVNTRFHVQHYDITQELETLGSIVDDMPVQQFQLYPPAIIKTKAYTKSIRIGIKSREKIEKKCEYQVLACQFEPQLVLIKGKGPLHNPETLNWQSLGWIELNPAKKVNENGAQSVPAVGVANESQTMSNLEKLKKELDLDHVTTEYTKLITGLNDILVDVDDKCIYIRVRIRKLVNFEDDEDDKDVAPLWIESHFSRLARLFIRNNIGGGAAALPSLVDLTEDMEDFDTVKDKSRRKKKKGKKKKRKRRHANPPGPSMDSMPEAEDDNDAIRKPTLPLLQHSGSLYEHDSEFTKQRRHSNYHIQDELYVPGILILSKSNIIWHDIVNNRDNIVSDKIPVSARSSCSMVVAHDVLVADDEHTGPEQEEEGKEERYTSIMFRIGGTLNKKTDRSVDMLDLTTGMWSSLPSLKHSRSWCEPALMNGNIVCAGGCGKKSKPLSSVELFDFEQSEWRELKALQQSRWGHAVYVMYYQDNDEIARTPVTPSMGARDLNVNESSKLIVAGGWSKKKKNLHSAEIYDVNRNKWSFIAPMNIARCRCVAMEWTSVDRVGVIGGWGDDTNKIVEYYDSEKDAWFRLNDLNYEHVYPSCGLLLDQHLYAMNRFLEQDAKQIINNHKISLMKGRPQPFVLGSNDQLSCLELFDDRINEWIILQTFTHSQNNIICMIECALPNDVTASLTQRGRGFSNDVRSERGYSESYSRRSSLWQRRGSKIIGML